VDGAIQEAIDLLGGIGQYVKPGDRALLKINLLVGTAPEKAVTTHPAVVRAAGATPLVGDCSGHEGPPNRGRYLSGCRQAGIQQVCQAEGVELVHLSAESVEVENPQGRTFKRFTLAKGVADADVVINLPKLKMADVLVWAGMIQDRYLSSRWKMFFDRSFFNGHAPSVMGKQLGFIISGPLSQTPNLGQILEASVEIQHASLAGFVTDEYRDSAQIDSLLQNLAKNLVRFADSSYIRPPTFLGVGGTKLFRDEIWGRLHFPFQADYRAYKKPGVFDFPQKEYKMRIQNAIGMAHLAG